FLIAGGSAALYRRRRLDRRLMAHPAAPPDLNESAKIGPAGPAAPASIADSLPPLPEPVLFPEPSRPLAGPPPPAISEPASVAAYRQRRLDRPPLPPIGELAPGEPSSPIAAYRL